MRFGVALVRIVRRVLTVDPTLGSVYLSKVEPDDTYMRLWVRLEYTPSTSLLLPKLYPADEHIVGFHLYLPMVWVDSAPYFCIAMETVTYLANQSMPVRHTASPHLLEGDSVTHAETDERAPIRRTTGSGRKPHRTGKQQPCK